jgi:MFS superfamily sulfate permease-like transporter
MLSPAPLGLPPRPLTALVIVIRSLIQPAEFISIRKVRTMEFRWAVAAAIGVLIFGTLDGIVVAIILSLIGLASQAAQPRLSIIGRKRGADVLRPLSPEHPDDETFDGLLILRPEGRLFFVNAQYVGEQIKALVAERKPRVLALDMSRVIDIEYSALQVLIEGEKRATADGAVVWLAALNPSVLEVARNSGLAQQLGPDRLLFNARAVIERYQAMQAGNGSLRPDGRSNPGAPA